MAVSNYRYNPFTFDELVKPMMLYKGAYDEMEEKYDALNASLGELAGFMNPDNPRDRKSYETYKKYMDQMDSWYEGFNQGMTAENKRVGTALFKDNVRLISPIRNAITKKAQVDSEWLKMRTQDPSLIVENNPDQYGVDDYVANPSLAWGNVVSGDKIKAISREAFAPYAEKLFDQYGYDGEGGAVQFKEFFGGNYKGIIQRYGWTPTAIKKLIQEGVQFSTKDENGRIKFDANTPFEQVAGQIMKYFGIDKWSQLSETNAEQIVNDVAVGMYAALGKDVLSVQQDHAGKGSGKDQKPWTPSKPVNPIRFRSANFNTKELQKEAKWLEGYFNIKEGKSTPSYRSLLLTGTYLGRREEVPSDKDEMLSITSVNESGKFDFFDQESGRLLSREEYKNQAKDLVGKYKQYMVTDPENGEQYDITEMLGYEYDSLMKHLQKYYTKDEIKNLTEQDILDLIDKIKLESTDLLTTGFEIPATNADDVLQKRLIPLLSTTTSHKGSTVSNIKKLRGLNKDGSAIIDEKYVVTSDDFIKNGKLKEAPLFIAFAHEGTEGVVMQFGTKQYLIPYEMVGGISSSAIDAATATRKAQEDYNEITSKIAKLKEKEENASLAEQIVIEEEIKKLQNKAALRKQTLDAHADTFTTKIMEVLSLQYSNPAYNTHKDE